LNEGSGIILIHLSTLLCLFSFIFCFFFGVYFIFRCGVLFLSNIGFSISYLPPFQISLVMFICSRFICFLTVIYRYLHRTKRTFSAEVFVHNRGVGVWLRLARVIVFVKVCALVFWMLIFHIFLVVLLSVCFSSILLDLAGGTFRSVEFLRLVLLWLPRLLSRYLGFPRDWEPIVVWFF
jgi:hypothetical protein